jgi:hypothetical protein
MTDNAQTEILASDRYIFSYTQNYLSTEVGQQTLKRNQTCTQSNVFQNFEIHRFSNAPQTDSEHQLQLMRTCQFNLKK